MKVYGLNPNNMKNLIKIEPIAVKDKNDVVKALTILEKIGIEIMTKKQKLDYIEDEKRIIDNNFMIQMDDGGFNIQSHYIGFGISIDNLEKQVDNIIEKIPNISKKIKEIVDRNNKLKEDLKTVNNNIKINGETISIVIKENVE